MERITSHVVNPANDCLQITVLDLPGPGGANHAYKIFGYNILGTDQPGYIEVRFQNGPINEAGVNGITHEALIAILVHRLRGFQSGPYACRENALALTKLEEAAHWLAHRTSERMARGVEGTHEK